MLAYIHAALFSFRSSFSRSTTWLLFCLVVLGFLGAEHVIGISSFCRFWGLGESGYHALLHLFRSQAWSFGMLSVQWATFVLSQDVAVIVAGRAVILGDHTLVAKDGRKMPGVVTLHQESETQTKKSYFRGHCWGAIGLLIGSLAAPFCLPLALRIHQGFTHIGLSSQDCKDTLGSRIVQMALEFALIHDLPSVLILDAFFPCAKVFRSAASVCSIATKQPLLTLIVKAKSNCVAYFEPPASKHGGPGRPPEYGQKVHLMELFDHPDKFSKTTCRIYGKVEEVSIMAVDLLWEPTDCLIRFVLALSSRGPIVLMCSDLTQDPVIALDLYCSRVRIEVMFDMLKNLLFAFSYHFWSKHMPRHSRRPKKNKSLKVPSSPSVPVVHRCWDAYERFVLLGSISLGLLQLIALKFSDSVWSHFGSFMRTQSRLIPSERTVKHVVAGLILKHFCPFAAHAILSEIGKRFVFNGPPPDEPPSVMEPEFQSALG
jgi:hypothetical protein